MKSFTTPSKGQFQLRARMRVPSEMLPSMYQFHVVQAIRRNPEVDKDGIYDRALGDITNEQNAATFAYVREYIERVMADPKAKKDPNIELMNSRWLNQDEDAYQNIDEFNHRFLNDVGPGALLMALTLEAIGLDPVAIDAFRGEDAVTAAYGKRLKQWQRRLGRILQQELKQFGVLDEPAMEDAADCYVEYRFLHYGNLPDYQRRKEHEGAARSEKSLRTWFGKFDRALGHRPAPRGRPRNKRGKR